MIRVKLFALIATCCLMATLTAGCSSLKPAMDEIIDSFREPETGILPESADFERLTTYTEWLYQQPARNLLSLYSEASRNVEERGTPLDQVNLAMLLSVPGTAFQDDAQALQLLESAGAGSTTGNRDQLQSFIRVQRVNLQSRDTVNRYWQGKLKLEKERNAVLRRQLEELKSIEQHLNQQTELLEQP